MTRVLGGVVLSLSILYPPFVAISAELYKWKDDDGVLHVANSLADVPEQYRDQVTTVESPPAPSRGAQQLECALGWQLGRSSTSFMNEADQTLPINSITPFVHLESGAFSRRA